MESELNTSKQKDILKLAAPSYFLRMIVLDFLASLFAIFGFLLKANLIHMQNIGYGLLILGLVELFFYTNYRVTFNNDGFTHRTIFRKQTHYRYEDIIELATGGDRFSISLSNKQIEVAKSGEKGRLFVKIAQAKGATVVDVPSDNNEESTDEE